MPNDVGIRVGVDGEKQFRDSLKGINSQLKNLNTEMQASSREFEKNSNSQQALKSKIDILNRSIDVEKQKIELLTKQYETQNKKLLSLGEELDKVSKEFGENSEQAGKAQNAYNRQAVQVNNLGSQLSAAKSNLNSFENQMKEAVAQSGKLTTGLKNAADKLDKFSTKASSIGNTLTLGVTVPLLGIGTAAVKTGNDFEAQMSRVEAISGATTDEIKKLDDLALKLGSDTAFSASEVAQGMENLASAGFTVDEIISAMPGMLDLAASSGADLATASEIAASSIRGFGLEASDAAHVADVFAEAAARTNAQTEDMGEAMNYIAPVANAMGQNLEEVAAAIGIMSDAGVKGSQAGTSLRGALSRLAKPTDKMYETMDKLGISFYDTAGNMLPLNEMIEQLQGSFTGLTQEEQNNALVTLFGQEALSGMMALIERGPDELRSLTKSFEGADGAASDMADTMLDNTAGSIEEMNGALETAAITLQRTLAPHIKNVAGFVTDLAEGFSELDEGTQQFIIGLGFTAAAAGPAVKAISGITSTVGKVSGGLGKLIEKVKELKIANETAGTATGIFSKAIGALASPTGAVVVATGLIAGLATQYIFSQTEAGKTAEEIRKLNERIKEQADGIQRIREEQEKNIGQAESESNYYQNLYSELDKIVDANGKIKEGYEERVEYILGELNEAYGVESSIIDGTIEKYDDLKRSIEDAINAGRAEKLLSTQEEGYTNAIDNLDASLQAISDARKLYDEALAKYKELKNFYDENNMRDETGALLNLSKNVKDTEKALEDAKKVYQDYLDQINVYEAAETAVMQGRYAEAVKISKSLTNNQKQYNKTNLQLSQENLYNEQENLKSLEALYEETGSETVKSQIEASKARIAVLQQEMGEALLTVQESQDPFVKQLYEFAVLGSSEYAENLDFQTPTMEQVSLIQEALNSGDPMIQQTAQLVAQGMLSAFTSKDPEMQQAGFDLLNEFQAGMQSEDPQVRAQAFDTAVGMANELTSQNPNCLQAGKDAMKEYSAGIEETKQLIKDVASGAGVAFIDGITDAIAKKAKQNPMVSWLMDIMGYRSNSTSSNSVTTGIRSSARSSSLLYSSEPSSQTPNSYSLLSRSIPSNASLKTSLLSKTALDSNQATHDAALKIANGIERRISANISPERQAIMVNLPKGNTGGMSLTQTNNFYSPEALSPAETARLNRINVRNAIKAMR